MRRCVITIALMSVVLMSRGMDYDQLISATICACDSPDLLLLPAFTNDVQVYRIGCSNSVGRCAADLSTSISLMHRLDHDEECVGNDACFRRHQELVSNIVDCAGLEEGSWIRYAAAVEYMTGLNYNNQKERAYALSTNMIERIIVRPPEMESTNYWKSMSRWMGCSNETFLTVFRLNAAIWCAENGRNEEATELTNSLPVSAVEIFRDELK